MPTVLDVILTVVVLSFWFLFPLGVFLSVSHVDKNTDQVVRLGYLRHAPVEEEKTAPRKRAGEPGPHWTFGYLRFKRWLHHH